MKQVTRSTIVGLLVYAGLSFAGWLAITDRLWAAYLAIFIVCIVGVILGNDNDNAASEETHNDVNATQ